MAEKGPRVEVVRGRRVETAEFGLRTAEDNIFHRKGHVEQMSSPERAADCRDRPFSGRKGDEQIVTRTIVTYTTDWTVVPGHEGSQHLSCNHPDTPQGRPSDNMFAQGPDYQLPHAFRAVFVLRAVEELTVEETAAALDIPEATVRTRFFRARSLLRESIEREADSALEDAFAFAGERCDRIVAGVLARLG